MAKFSSRRRVTLDKPEEVLNLAQRLLAPVKKQAKWLILGIILVLAASVTWGITTRMQARQEERAAEALAKLRPKAPGTEASPEAVKALDQFMKDYPGTRAAREAELLKAHLLYQQKNYAEAAKAYEALQGHNPEWDTLIPESLSYCYEAQGDFKKAAQALQPLVDKTSGPFQGELMRRLALMYEQAKDPQQAVIYWRRLLDQPPDPSLVPYLKEKVAANEAQAKK